MACVSGTMLLQQIDDARAEGRMGALILGNVDDLLVEPATRAGPLAVPYAILRHFGARGFSTGLASVSRGLEPVRTPGASRGPSAIAAIGPTDGPEAILRGITALLRGHGARVAIVIQHAGHFAPPGAASVSAEILYEWSADKATRWSGNFVVLLDTSGEIHPLVREAWGFKLIRAGAPARAEREAYVSQWLQSAETGGAHAADLPVRVGALTGGLRLVEIDSLLRGAAARKETLGHERVRAERASRLTERLDGIAEVKEPTIGWADVAGLPHVKDHFQDVAKAARSGAGLTGATLLAGVPGVGKSFTAQALAREVGVPVVFIRNLFSPWVGSSEARVERLVETLAAFDGCVCVFEEVDQLLGRRDARASGDGGTTERVRGRLMEFMGGSYPGIHFIGLTNRPDLLDVANLDRFSVRIPILHPSTRDRVELLRALFTQERRACEPDVDFRAVATAPALGMATARGLKDVVRMAARLADRELGSHGAKVAARHLREAVNGFEPRCDTIEHEFVALTAIATTQFRAYLPWMSWEGRRKDVDLQPYLRGIVNDGSGEIDEAALQGRLKMLGNIRRPWSTA